MVSIFTQSDLAQDTYHAESLRYSLILAHRIRWVNTISDDPASHSSECDLWDVNCSPRGTKCKKSQRNPSSAPGSELKCRLTGRLPWFTWHLCGMPIQVICRGILRLSHWVLKADVFLNKQKIILAFFPLVPISIICNCGDMVFPRRELQVERHGHSS